MSAGLEALRVAPTEKWRGGIVFGAIVFHPFKVFAAFFAGPFLILRLTRWIGNPLRRWGARIALLVTIAASYALGMGLGLLVSIILYALKFELTLALWVGGYMRLVFCVGFSILILNSLVLHFLRKDREEVIAYLRELDNGGSPVLIRKKR